ncbi:MULTISPECIES: hypothetical protein [unclassified Herbaspirillum]|uniref:hypothetical protein n=1 Tax=unclassified Herbaspirillum TaxID=2624150 RepID=UPI00143000BA|nr:MULTISPECIES: hypothetical protein [unclassified Herbaspirillum]
MNIAVTKRIGIVAVVLALSAAGAHARPPEGSRGGPVQPTDLRHQGGNNFGNGGNRPQQQEQDANQRRGKLSPDERRELRRQIDEAGQDIYRVKR